MIEISNTAIHRVLHPDLKSKIGIYEKFQNITNISQLSENEDQLDAIFSSGDPDHYFSEMFQIRCGWNIMIIKND